MRGIHAPRPVQACCRLCERLFCYFKLSKPRILCSPCAGIERRLAVAFSNDRIRDDRRRRASFQMQIGGRV